jgi:hypothetical protein
LFEGCDFEIGAASYFMLGGLLASVYFTHVLPFGYLIYVSAIIVEYWI